MYVRQVIWYPLQFPKNLRLSRFFIFDTRKGRWRIWDLTINKHYSGKYINVYDRSPTRTESAYVGRRSKLQFYVQTMTNAANDNWLSHIKYVWWIENLAFLNSESTGSNFTITVIRRVFPSPRWGCWRGTPPKKIIYHLHVKMM